MTKPLLSFGARFWHLGVAKNCEAILDLRKASAWRDLHCLPIWVLYMLLLGLHFANREKADWSGIEKRRGGIGVYYLHGFSIAK
jgi:hypothetical protein